MRWPRPSFGPIGAPDELEQEVRAYLAAALEAGATPDDITRDANGQAFCCRACGSFDIEAVPLS
jgi:hypothetical protein